MAALDHQYLAVFPAALGSRLPCSMLPESGVPSLTLGEPDSKARAKSLPNQTRIARSSAIVPLTRRNRRIGEASAPIWGISVKAAGEW
ncbi:MAG: hypothetical protein ABI836_07500 [Gemmatimonadota bacterium]